MQKRVYLITESIQVLRNFINEFGLDMRNYCWINSYTALIGNANGLYILLDEPGTSRLVFQMHEQFVFSNIHYHGGVVYTRDGEVFNP